jgi:hypothetical protein
MAQETQIRLVRVFISSPGDVNDERNIARRVIHEANADPLLRDRVLIQAVAWDDPASRVANTAIHTPQEAINRGMRQPKDCDIAVVIFWKRMGTPLDLAIYHKDDGSPYLSGTEWEFENAMRAARADGKPDVLVYRRTEEPLISMDDPERDEKLAQYDRVKTFFKQFKTEQGIWKGSYEKYDTPATFQSYLENDLKSLIRALLEHEPVSETPAAELAAARALMPQWKGSPFPGLRVFTPDEAPIFFGRGQEIDDLFTKVRQQHFVVVVGASGSGKSSLVSAGLLPRLADMGDWLLPHMQGSANARDWAALRLTPGARSGDPFLALAHALAPLLANADPAASALNWRLSPQTFVDACASVVQQHSTKPEALLFFVDQFEELMSIVTEAYRAPFIHLLMHASRAAHIRIVATLRADFYHRFLSFPDLAEPLKHGTFPLAPPSLEDLPDMILRPAHMARIEFEPGLEGRIIQDTGAEPGGLPLMAYALDELYRACEDTRRFTFAAYDSIGGVQNAIGERANGCFDALDETAKAAFARVFELLSTVDDEGVTVRQRARLSQIATVPGGEPMVQALAAVNLLVLGKDDDDQPTVDVAHEALFQRWERLRQWADESRDFLRWRRKFLADVAEWKQQGKNPSYLYRGVQLKLAQLQWAAHPEVVAIGNAQAFQQASERAAQRRLLVRSVAIAVPVVISLITIAYVVYLLILRENARAPMVRFPASQALVGDPARQLPVPVFAIDQHEVTYRQYRLCMQAGVCSRPVDTAEAPTHIDDADVDDLPVMQVTAYQAAAFCRWLGLRLPSSLEWERAARGTDGRTYPWSEDVPTPDHVNAGLIDYLDSVPERTVAVNAAAYALGATPEGIMHLIGNVSEWTRTPSACDDPYTCAPLWDGEARINSLIVRGLNWQVTLPPNAPLLPVTEHLPVTPNYTLDPQIGFRCAGE